MTWKPSLLTRDPYLGIKDAYEQNVIKAAWDDTEITRDEMLKKIFPDITDNALSTFTKVYGNQWSRPPRNEREHKQSLQETLIEHGALDANNPGINDQIVEQLLLRAAISRMIRRAMLHKAKGRAEFDIGDEFLAISKNLEVGAIDLLKNHLMSLEGRDDYKSLDKYDWDKTREEAASLTANEWLDANQYSAEPSTTSPVPLDFVGAGTALANRTFLYNRMLAVFLKGKLPADREPGGSKDPAIEESTAARLAEWLATTLHEKGGSRQPPSRY